MEKNQQKTYIHFTFLLYIYIYIKDFAVEMEKKNNNCSGSLLFFIRARFRSWDLWVMGPPRFRCATLISWYVLFFIHIYTFFFFFNARLSWAFGLLMIFRLNNTKPIFVLFCGSKERHGLFFFFFSFCAQIKEKQLLICL